MPTNKETYDIVLAHLRSQGARCTDGAVCRYRWEGRRCAAGILIPDECYSPTMEGRTVMSCGGHSTQAGRCLLDLGYDLVFVSQLQGVHDNTAAWDAKGFSA